MLFILERRMSFHAAATPATILTRQNSAKFLGNILIRCPSWRLAWEGIIVSGFFMPGGRLRVPDQIPDSELLQDPLLVKVDGKSVRDAMRLLEHGKDNYWTGGEMVERAVYVVLLILRCAFPNYQALFASDNASNRCSFSEDAPVAR